MDVNEGGRVMSTSDTNTKETNKLVFPYKEASVFLSGATSAMAAPCKPSDDPRDKSDFKLKLNLGK